jgi:serine/threonine-protein kinase
MKDDVPESEQRRFRLEARLCGSFMHPNLVRILDVGTTREHHLYWFAMEFLEGRDLSAAMEGGRTVPLHVLCEIFRQTLEALHYVHLRRIVHRDIKPANIFVTHDPCDPQFRPVKVLDFGVAKDLNDLTPEDPRFIMGDPRYMPPEQTRPGQPIDHRGDLYALGMTFYEAITGHHPFEDKFDEHPSALLRCHRERDPGLPSTFLSSSTPADAVELIDAFFTHACARDPDGRFADARAMQRALESLQAFA